MLDVDEEAAVDVWRSASSGRGSGGDVLQHPRDDTGTEHGGGGERRGTVPSSKQQEHNEAGEKDDEARPAADDREELHHVVERSPVEPVHAPAPRSRRPATRSPAAASPAEPGKHQSESHPEDDSERESAPEEPAGGAWGAGRRGERRRQRVAQTSSPPPRTDGTPGRRDGNESRVRPAPSRWGGLTVPKGLPTLRSRCISLQRARRESGDTGPAARQGRSCSRWRRSQWGVIR